MTYPTPSPPVRKPRRTLWIAGGATGLFVVAMAVGAMGFVAFWRSSPAPAGTASNITEVAPQRLIGRWSRPDGGYVLDIRGAQADGHLDVAYLNPSPIRVSRAEWRRDGAGLRVFIELRDVNYPGSTYTLAYLPHRDRMTGAYFQAAQRRTFDVEFVRQ